MEKSSYKIDIIGAGIGGLTTALFLQSKGIKFHIYEKSKHFPFTGSGIILANNAMQVYKKLGIQEEIEKDGNVVSSIKITRSDLSIISKIDLAYFEKNIKLKI